MKSSFCRKFKENSMNEDQLNKYEKCSDALEYTKVYKNIYDYIRL